MHGEMKCALRARCPLQRRLGDLQSWPQAAQLQCPQGAHRPTHGQGGASSPSALPPAASWRCERSSSLDRVSWSAPTLLKAPRCQWEVAVLTQTGQWRLLGGWQLMPQDGTAACGPTLTPGPGPALCPFPAVGGRSPPGRPWKVCPAPAHCLYSQVILEATRSLPPRRPGDPQV